MKGACQNSPCIEITPATIICGEGDFLFMRVSTHPHIIRALYSAISLS